jgi:hypothetical protein
MLFNLNEKNKKEKEMTREEFVKMRSKLLEECDQITVSKGLDYVKSSPDILLNFKEGEVFGLTPLQTVGLFTKKHVDSIYNYIKTNGQSESEPIRERIKDAINYLIFINAIIEENESSRPSNSSIN